MIFVHQDPSKIPEAWLKKVAGLQVELEACADKAARKAFVRSAKASIWGEIKGELLNLSHNKCWYSEAPDAVSDWHVDHYRPKGRALDEDGTEHDGYAWLALDWLNYRIAGSYPNSPHLDDQGVARGKWDYFPLTNFSVRATWDNRNTEGEVCLILDPAKKSDPKLMTFDEQGLPRPADPNNAIVKKKVEVTIHYLFLDSPRLVAARKRKWRDTSDWIDEYLNVCPPDLDQCTRQDVDRFERHIAKLSELTGPDSPYASTARACLRANGLDFLIKTPEEALAA